MKHSNGWKGGRIKRTGYWYVFKPDHPNSGKQGYIAEHRLVMEKHIARFLEKGEVVHHINQIITDNRIENLKLYSSPGKHTSIEHRDHYERLKILSKGKRYSPRTEFKKGFTPWNKGLKIPYKPRPRMRGRILRNELGRIIDIK